MAKPAKADAPQAAGGALKSLPELLALTGATAADVAQAVKAGHIAKPDKGRYNLGPALIGLIKFYRARAADVGSFPHYTSMAECAAHTGIPVSVLKSGKKSADCDAFKWGRVDTGKFIRWLFASQKEENWKGHYDKYHALREELRHSHESGDTLTKAEVMHAVSKGSSAFFSVLEEMANKLPPHVKGMDEQGCHTIVCEWVDNARQNLIDGLGKLGKDGK